MKRQDDNFSKQAAERLRLENEEKIALSDWFVKALQLKDKDTPISMIAAEANKSCEQWAKQYGIKIVASMAHRGILKPDESPYNAFLDLLFEIEEKDQQIRIQDQEIQSLKSEIEELKDG